MKNVIKNRLNRLFKFIYTRLFLLNDSPQRIALGFGLGVFLGVMPGMGPIASLILASLFRLNRSAALFGSIMLNTWINFLTLILAIKIGSVIMGLNWNSVYAESVSIFKNFRFAKLFDLPILTVITPILVGYFVIAVCAAILAYLVVLIILKAIRHNQYKTG